MSAPSPHDVARIARDVLGEPVVSTERFPTGAGNWVYDVSLASRRRVVVRLMRDRCEFEAAVHWNKTLRSQAVPLPQLIAYQRSFDDDPSTNGWFVLERLPGTDLGNVYATLTRAQKMSVLDGVLRAQAIVHRSVPSARRFGYSNMPESAPHPDWQSVVAEGLQISRQRIIDVGVVDPVHVGRVERLLPAFGSYFASVKPIPFLDDTTTRNVIIDDGALQGIVDVDSICYGDPLLVCALTRMALLSMGCDTIYTNAWLDRLGATPGQRRALDLYTAIFAVNFLGEQGQQFNRDAPPAVDPAEVDNLIAILDLMLGRIE